MLQRHNPKQFFHGAVEVGGVIYLSGLTADDRALGLKGQTTQVLEKLEKALTDLGAIKAHVVSATVYLTDMEGKDQLNDAWLEFFTSDELPARATVGVASLGPGVLIEVACIAARL